MTKWLPIIVTVLTTVLTAIFTPSFVASHLTLFTIFNALSMVLHSVLPSTVGIPTAEEKQ